MPDNARRGKGLGAYPFHLFGVVAVVTLATMYLGQKVELSRLVGRLEETQGKIQQLEKERTKLKVTIALKKRGDRIVTQAKNRLAMTAADGNEIDLVWGLCQKNAGKIKKRTGSATYLR